jgi:hemolysin III
VEAPSRTQRRPQSRGEELANSLIHGLAFVAAAVALPLLIASAVRRGETAYVVGASIFGATAALLYLASTIYHALPCGPAKRLFQVIDHGAIYLLIAGTYTPFTLGALRGAWGWTLFAIIWTLAALGILAKVFGTALWRRALSIALYLAMGWLVVVAAEPLMRLVPPAGLLWLLAGGLAYSGGVVFYATDSRLRYGHSIWHVFVGVGTFCHYMAVAGYAA